MGRLWGSVVPQRGWSSRRPRFGCKSSSRNASVSVEVSESNAFMLQAPGFGIASSAIAAQRVAWFPRAGVGRLRGYGAETG